MIRSLLDRGTGLLMAVSARLLPPAQGEWLKAMRAELACIADPAARLSWSAGCLAAAFRMRAATADARFVALALALLALVTVQDWRNADPTVTLIASAAVPAGLAYSAPRHCWRVGLLFGLWLLVAHAVADLSAGLRPHYQRLPLSAAELVEIALLLGITLPAALCGAEMRRLRQRRRI